MKHIEFFCVVCEQLYIVIWQPSETHRFVRMPCQMCRKQRMDSTGAWWLFPTVDVDGVLRAQGLGN